MVRVLVATLALAFVGIGCGEAAQTTPRAADIRLDPTERIVRLKVALAELREDPDAAGSAVALSRAETWVARAESLTRTHTDPELRDLLLDTAEGQVTTVRSSMALRKSARALEARGAGHAPPPPPPPTATAKSPPEKAPPPAPPETSP